MKQCNAKASADVFLLEDGTVQARPQLSKLLRFESFSILNLVSQANSRTMRPFLGDRQVVEMVQRAVHSGTPSMIETRFPNRSGPSMLFVRSSPTVKNFIDGLQVVAQRTLRRSFLLLAAHCYSFRSMSLNFVQFFLFCSRTH
jgi:hypothetical protein